MGLIQWLPFLATHQIHWRSLLKIEIPSFLLPPAINPLFPGWGEGITVLRKTPPGDWIGVAATFVNLCSKSMSEGLCSLRCGFKAFGSKPATAWNQVQEQTTYLKSQLSSFILLYTTPMGLSFPWGVPVTWGRIFHELCHTALHFSELPETVGR